MRRKQKIKREIKPDFKYSNTSVSKLINSLMEMGKKSVAEAIVYGAFKEIEKNLKKDPLEIFDKAIKNTAPMIEVRSRRIGGSNYQVPREVRGERKLTLSFRWILSAARSRKGIPMSKKLALELMDAARGEGTAVKRRSDVHRMAEANKAFAHFSW